jgi:hypothetical protein
MQAFASRGVAANTGPIRFNNLRSWRQVCGGLNPYKVVDLLGDERPRRRPFAT